MILPERRLSLSDIASRSNQKSAGLGGFGVTIFTGIIGYGHYEQKSQWKTSLMNEITNWGKNLILYHLNCDIYMFFLSIRGLLCKEYV